MKIAAYGIAGLIGQDELSLVSSPALMQGGAGSGCRRGQGRHGNRRARLRSIQEIEVRTRELAV